MLKKHNTFVFCVLILLTIVISFGCQSLEDMGDCEDISWSPDSKRIVCKTFQAIYVMRNDGSQIHKIDSYSAAKWYSSDTPVWSPDGRQVLFSAYPQNTDPGNIYQIYA